MTPKNTGMALPHAVEAVVPKVLPSVSEAAPSVVVMLAVKVAVTTTPLELDRIPA